VDPALRPPLGPSALALTLTVEELTGTGAVADIATENGWPVAETGGGQADLGAQVGQIAQHTLRSSMRLSVCQRPSAGFSSGA
jgi:hypothetical protein